MPFYSYQCQCEKCVVDELHKMGKEPKEYFSTCSCCNGERVKFKKIMTPVGFRLKGDGWFKKTSSFD